MTEADRQEVQRLQQQIAEIQRRYPHLAEPEDRQQYEQAQQYQQQVAQQFAAWQQHIATFADQTIAGNLRSIGINPALNQDVVDAIRSNLYARYESDPVLRQRLMTGDANRVVAEETALATHATVNAMRPAHAARVRDALGDPDSWNQAEKMMAMSLEQLSKPVYKTDEKGDLELKDGQPQLVGQEPVLPTPTHVMYGDKTLLNTGPTMAELWKSQPAVAEQVSEAALEEAFATDTKAAAEEAPAPPWPACITPGCRTVGGGK